MDRALHRAFWDDPWENMRRPSRLFDQRFGHILSDDFSALPHILSGGELRPPPYESGMSEVINGDDAFRIALHVEDFRPDEVKVKTKGQRVIVIASHEEREDGVHGYITRGFSRQYCLPKDVDPETLTSVYRDGILKITAPKKVLEEPVVINIPITLEGDVPRVERREEGQQTEGGKNEPSEPKDGEDDGPA